MEKRGYSVNDKAQAIIKICSDWYENEIIDNFHKRKNLNNVDYELSQMNFAKRCCADDANLCEIISVVPEKEAGSEAFIEELLQNNRFDVMYRQQLEKTAATGTVGAYISLRDANYMENSDGKIMLKGGMPHINYVDADCIIPLTVENGLVKECAFCITNRVQGKNETMLVMFPLENDCYSADTVVFDELGHIVSDKCESVRLGDVKPFAIMQTAEVNNLKNMKGYGLPKLYNAIPMLKAIDLCYNLLYGDIDKGQKLVFINELLACIQRDQNGNPYLTKQQKEVFILLGGMEGKLPDEETLVQEYNPEIRIDAITKAFELVLSLLSMSFGYGTKKYTFENGKITTATEYIGEKQDSMQELNKQRKQATDYITDIIHAAMWFSNAFHGTSYNVEEELSIEFDDSYIEDKQAKLESMRADALSFSDVPILKVWYLMEKYNLSEEEAQGYIQSTEEPIDDLDD